MTEPTIDQFMTRAPHTIGYHQTLATAHRMMRELSIRHLPVLDGGKLVGILSQRDLHFIETLKDVDPDEVPVSEAECEFVRERDLEEFYGLLEQSGHSLVLVEGRESYV